MTNYNLKFLEGLNAARHQGLTSATFTVKPVEKMSYQQIIDHPQVTITLPVLEDVDSCREWKMFLEKLQTKMSKSDYSACLPEAGSWKVSYFA